MDGRFSRTERLFGKEGMEKLRNSCVAVFGVGGVGSYIAEGLARSGVGHIHLIDSDDVDITNLNRQIEALSDVVGKPKAEAMKSRILLINPECDVVVHNCFFLPENSAEFDFSRYDYVADAVDTVTAKIELVKKAQREGTPIISSMGTGNKLCPSMLEVADIYKTSVCPLARVMRQELKKHGIKKLKVVYSKEEPINALPSEESNEHRRSIPASAVFVPGTAGLIIASEIVKDLVR
ncbi:MAG: ThiF family adenylyltransferase [Oscillospiraceae bacterium]